MRWYCKYGISYRDLAEMMQERGVGVDPSTILRRVQRHAPELEKRIRPYQGHGSGSWRDVETYIHVGGKWKYLFRVIDKHGQLIDVMLADRRDTGAAYRLLRKALKMIDLIPGYWTGPSGDFPVMSPRWEKGRGNEDVQVSRPSSSICSLHKRATERRPFLVLLRMCHVT